MKLDFKVTLVLPPYADHPRNSEGTFAQLSDGRILFVYSGYRGESHWDDCTCNLVSRESSDQGRTWSKNDELVVDHGVALNVMSPSLLRLQDGRLALLYLKKSASKEFGVECRPQISFSSDDGVSWSEPRQNIVQFGGYQVINNDRLIQLKSGRLILPVALHRPINHQRHDSRSIALYYLSDDGGASWREGVDWVLPPQHCDSGLQEPGALDLGDNRVLGWARTTAGSQFLHYSPDGGEHWSISSPSEFVSPNGPLSMKRDPVTGIIYAVWNDHTPGRFPDLPPWEQSSCERTPLVLARSFNNGATWMDHQLLGADPRTGYCYVGMHFTGDRGLLLSFCCGGINSHMLQKTQIVRIELDN